MGWGMFLVSVGQVPVVLVVVSVVAQALWEGRGKMHHVVTVGRRGEDQGPGGGEFDGG